MRFIVSTLAVSLLVASAARTGLAQQSREQADRSLKGAVGTTASVPGEALAAYELVQGLLRSQALEHAARRGARSEEQVELLLEEGLRPSLEEAGLARQVQDRLLDIAHQRLSVLRTAAQDREDAEAAIKRALEGSSLLEEELHDALHGLLDLAATAGPGLLEQAIRLAEERSAGALPGQEVEPEPLPLVEDLLATRFEGRGLSTGELRELAEPILILVRTRSELDDAVRFTRAWAPTADELQGEPDLFESEEPTTSDVEHESELE